MDQSEKRIRSIFIVLISCLVFAGMFLFFKPKLVDDVQQDVVYHTENQELESANGIVVQHNYIPYTSPRRPGEVREIHYITIHETDNRHLESGASAHSNFLSGNNTDITGWHYTVDDHEIIHHIPDNEIAWNAGDNRSIDGGNMNGIGIEMCVNVDNDYEKTLKNTACLVVGLMNEYDLTPKDLRFHKDFMDKVCPHRLMSEGRLDDFEKMVIEEYNKTALKKEEG